MSDLETPEADMMRDHSSVDTAPTTLRLEESQPGLDPDNPGAAPNSPLTKSSHPEKDTSYRTTNEDWHTACGTADLANRLRQRAAKGPGVLVDWVLEPGMTSVSIY